MPEVEPGCGVALMVAELAVVEVLGEGISGCTLHAYHSVCLGCLHHCASIGTTAAGGRLGGGGVGWGSTRRRCVRGCNPCGIRMGVILALVLALALALALAGKLGQVRSVSINAVRGDLARLAPMKLAMVVEPLMALLHHPLRANAPDLVPSQRGVGGVLAGVGTFSPGLGVGGYGSMP